VRLGFIGGTGPEGRGLGLRLALAGHDVVLGSRSSEKAQTEAVKLGVENITGAGNVDACASADVVFVTVPFEGQADLLPQLADACAGKIVVSTVVPMRFDAGGPAPLRVTEGSAAEQCQALLPTSRVVSAFQLLPATKLEQPDVVLDMDVPVCGDDAQAVDTVAELVSQIRSLRAVIAGPLRLSSSVEGVTPLLLSINRRYKRHTGVRFAGLDT
jgi:8-hydroxy-5-deazaflavin:NADPH oxidoreductase